MTEKVRIKLDDQFRLEIEAVDPHEAEGKFHPVIQIHELSPYGMFLAGIGSCTAMVVMTYANNHDLSLDEVKIQMVYDRDFDQDCEECENIEGYDEFILETIYLEGELSEEIEQKLLQIAHQCPLEIMVEQGVKILHTKD
jgi:uncharacterized OsmC-like protein